MTRKSIETVKWTLQREIDPECSPALVRDQIVTEPLVQSMQHTFTLYGHTGCVNTLNWNHSGTLLASGSDDQQILLWSRGGRLLRRLPTIHTNNIFSVLFVPHTRDHLILSAAGDNQILLHELGQISGDGQQPAHIQRWECGGRVKKLVTCRAEPRLFWSASEDGMLKQFDLRESSSTDFDFSNDHGPLKSLAINESRPEMLAVGLSNPMIPIYDRRNMKEPMMRLIPAHLSLGGSEGRFLATSLAFNEDGNELLANIGSDNIYIFNVIEKQCQVEVFRMLKNFIEEDIKFPLSAKSEQNKDSQLNARANSTSSLNGQFLTETNKLADEKEFSRVIDMCSDALISYLEKNNLPADIFPHLLSTVNDENTTRICAKLALHIGPIIHLLATRGQCLKERDWEGDQLDAIRDFLCVLRIFPVHGSVHFNLVKSLYMLKQQELARQCFALYKKLYPEDFSAEQIIRKYEEEKPQQNEESVGPPSWNNESGKRFRDYIGRFTGHLNINTDIKEASWFGAENQYIVSGSDCGSIFIWERKTQKAIRMFKGDNYTVNCVQPHPTSCLIASSGIDNVIRFWEPSPIATKRNVRSKDDPNDREEQNEENEDKDMTAAKYEHMKRNRRRRTPELVWEQLLNSVGLGLFRVDSAQDANDEEDQEPNGDDDAPHVIRCRQM